MIWQKADLDGNGKIDRVELAVFVKEFQVSLKDELMDLDVLFDNLDTDGDGMVSIEEFETFFEPIVQRYESKGWKAQVYIFATLCTQ